MLLAFWMGCAAEAPADKVPGLGTQAGDVTDASQPLTVVARDAERGVPTMAWAPLGAPAARPGQKTPEAAARRYLEQHASLYRLSPTALQAAFVHRVHDTGRGGIIVAFRQRVGGIDVVRNELKVLMTRDLSLVAITGNLHDGVEGARATARSAFRTSAAQAVAATLGDLYGITLEDTAVVARAEATTPGRQRFDLASGRGVKRAGVSLVVPAEVRQVYFPQADRLVPAWSVDVLAERIGQEGRRGYEYLVDADQGGTLQRSNRIFHDSYSYRVWADADGTPQDGPLRDFTPYPNETPNETFESPRNITVDGRAHAGGVDSWLPPGATTTSGNNVSAYADHSDPDGYTEGSDTWAFVNPATRDFHYDYEPTLGPLARPSQTQAAITSLFYTTNWLHDYYYASGFNEAKGNAQRNNHGRGGLEGDALLAEAQNQGPNPQVRNNAAIYVPDDGLPPRMEMYLFEMPETRSFQVAEVDYATGRANFGPRTFHLDSLRLVLAQSGSASVTTACQALTNDVSGAIVLADRGGNCSYELKAVNAQAAGAAGLIVLNHTEGAPPPNMFESDPLLDPTLPLMSVSYETGQTLKGLLANGPVAGTMSITSDPERDGTIDNTIVSHEWGHLLHLRLVDCHLPVCLAQSEGWGDFIALHLMVREKDAFNYNGTYGIGGYAAHVLGDSLYYGIRRVPYSRDPTKNALRLRHLSDDETLPVEPPLRDNGGFNSESHNAGEVWASMLFDGYLALLDEAEKTGSTFAEAKRRMADYVVAGMVAAPVDPTLTEQRDALLMAAGSQDPRDMDLLAQAFAGRGAGTCARSPPRRSLNFTEVHEAYTVQADLRFEFVKVDDARRTCDAVPDGILDAGEAGSLHLKITNLGPVKSEGTPVTVVSNRPGEVILPTGELWVPSVPPFGSISMAIPIELAVAPTRPRDLELTLTPSGSGFCQAPVPLRHVLKVDHDEEAATTDTFESPSTAWSTVVLKGAADQAWQRVLAPDSTVDAANHVWFIADGPDLADTALVSPRLTVSGSVPFTVTFDHRHRFAFDVDSWTGQKTFWTGGVIELTQDGGQTWEDVSKHAEPGYGGKLDSTTSNPLGGQQAYVAQSSLWPRMNQGTKLDFGSRFAGKTVQLRFRFGSPWYVESHGWEVDNVVLSGVVGKPFKAVIPNAGTCMPSANAGADQLVESGAAVTLQGSGHSTASGTVMTYTWRQLDGPPVELTGGGTASAWFLAPIVSSETPMHFELTVSVGPLLVDTDTLEIRVKPEDPTTDPDPDPDPNVGGGGCASASPTSEPSTAWVGWLVGMLAARRLALRRAGR
ncbi:peptidase [Corallococcus exiguus]|nr:peptidase [Corallococcus exiguus]